MTSSDTSSSAVSPQSYRFLALYALAWAGGAVAYVPFLTILLPVRVTALTGAADISWLAYATFFGAVTASVSNIAFGWASDLTQTRRPWVLAGLIVTIIMFAVIAVVDDPVSLIGAILLWQVGLNMMLAPLAAWAGDRVPNAQKGILGGLTALAPAVGAVVGIIVTMPGLAGAAGRLAMIAVIVSALILPVVLAGGQSGTTATGDDAGMSKDGQVTVGKDMVVLWLARLAIQISEAALFAYLLFYFRSLDPKFLDADVARIFGGVLIVTVPIALLCGRWMDRSHRPVLALLICAVVAAVGLALMASAAQLGVALAGYIIFGMGSAVFLALHSGQTLRVLYHSERRGRSLGLFNLTNTIPSLIVPWLTLLIVPNFGFAPLIWLLATLSFAAALLLTAIVRQR